MKKLRIAVIAVLIVVAFMITAHLTLSVNWPEVFASLHGR